MTEEFTLGAGEAPKISVGLLNVKLDMDAPVSNNHIQNIRQEAIEKHILRLQNVLKEKLGIDVNDFPLDY